MASYEELKKRVASGETTTTQSNKSSYAALKERVKKERFERDVNNVDSSYINLFVDTANRYFDSAEEDYGKVGWGNAYQSYLTRRDSYNDLEYRRSVIQKWMENNQDRIDADSYRNLSGSLSNFGTNASGILSNFSNAKSFYSQFDTEDDYLAYKDYDEKSKFDLKKGQNEVEHLERVLEEYKMLTRFTTDEKGALRSSQIRQQYGDEKAIKSLIAQKKQYLNQAKHIQEGITLSGVSGNADFDQHSGYKTTQKENPAWWESGTGDTQYEWINNQNGFRETWEQSMDDLNAQAGASSQSGFYTGPKESTYEELGYDHLTENEIAIYNYYYAKEGKDKAQEYLDSIQETLNHRKATEMFTTLEDNTALELLFGVNAGLDQFKSGLSSLLNTEDDYIAQSAYQIASGMVREDLADNGPKILGNSLGQIGYDAITTSANMAPSILTSMVIGMVNPVAGQIAGHALMGASAAGNAYQEALNQGFDKDQARGYGLLVGASEIAMEKILGGISALGGNALGKFLTKNVSNADTALKMIAKKLGGSMLSEFTEEYLQEVMTPVFQNIMLGTDNEVKLFSADALYAGILGALTAGVMEGPTTIAGEVKTYQTGKRLQAADISAQRLAEIGSTFAADTVAYQIAGKVDENTSAYTMGKLFNEIGATLTEQNVNDISQALVAKGMSEDVAKANAKAMATVVEGDTLTDLQVAVIEANEDLAEAVRTTIIDPNATWFQRTQGYNEALMALAQEKTAPKTSQTNPAQEGQENATVSDTTDTDAENGSKIVSGADSGPAKVSSITSIKDGNVTIKLEDGSEVNAVDADLDPEDGVIIETIAKIGGISANDANYILSSLKASPGVNSQWSALGANEAYKYGFYGMSEEHMTKHGVFANSLTETQRKAIYETGRNARNATVQKKTQLIAESATVAKSVTTGKVHFDGDTSKLTERQSASLTAMGKIADALGVQIHVFESKVGANGKRIGANGWYDPKDNSIHIDLHAGANGEGTMLFTLAHELTHHIRKWSPAKFKILADFLMEEYGKKGVNVDGLVREQMNKAKRNGRSISYDTAYEEVVADSMEMMLSDGNVMKRLEKLKAKDKDLWQKIKSFIDDLAAKIRNVYKGLAPDSVEGRYVADMGKAVYKLQELFAEALVDASENYQMAEKNTTQEGGVGKYSFRGKNKDGIEVYETSEYVKSLSWKERKKLFLQMMRNQYRGRTAKFVRNGHAYYATFEYRDVSKNIYGDTASDPKGRDAKINVGADGNIFELVEHSEYFLSEAERGKTQRMHRGVKYWDYFIKTVQIDGNVYDVLAHIRKKDSGSFVYDIEMYENKKIEPSSPEDSLESGRNGMPNSSKTIIGNGNDVVKSENLVPGEEGVVTNRSGDPVAYATEDGSVLLSMRTYEEEGREAFRNYLQKCVSGKKLTKAEMQEMLDGIEEIYGVCKEFKDQYAPFSSWSDAAVVRDTRGRPVFSVVTPNGDYKMNLDFSLVCKKRRTLDAVFNEMSKRGIIDDFELGQKSVVKINEIIRKYGLETACALCFVDAKRFRQASMADQFTSLYNELVESLVPEDQKGSIDHFNFSGYDTIKKVEGGIDTWDNSKLDFSHLDHVLKTYGDGTVEYKAAKYIKNNPQGRKLLLRGDFMSSQGFDAVKTQNQDILKLYNSKKGTGGPKAAFGDVQYMNEVIQKARWWTPKKAYEVGGIRIQSFSDYVPRMVFDYVQMIYDLAATKLPAHAYTKEALFVKQFGLTGVKINMSLIPAIAEGGIAPGLDANGNYVWAGESFDFETAKQIQNAPGYTENCGTICVGVSDRHIRKLLSDPDIRMVIPYHKSGLNPIVAHMNKIAEFTDYTNKQNTTVKDTGSKAEKHFDFNAALHKMGKNADPRAVIQQYFDWCDDNGYEPKFAEFRDHPNYYKLIEDFTLFDKDGNYVPQREVRAVFPKADSAFGSMKDLIQEGLQEDAIVEGKRDSSLSAIVDEIQKVLPRTEAEIAEEQVEQADRDLEEIKRSDRDNAPTFYSHMARVVDGVKQAKLGAASVVSMLRGKGVKAEEIKWSGIEAWLEGKKSVTKAELQEFIAGSMLQIEEDMLTDKEIPYSQEHLDQIAKYEAERDIIAENLKSEWKRIVGTDIPITNFGAGLESAVVHNLLEANATKKGNTEVGYKYKAKRAALQRVIEDGDHYFGFDNARQAFREAVRNPNDFMNSYEMTSFEKGVFRDFIKAKEAYNKVEGISMEDQKALKSIAESADRFSNRILKVKTEHRTEAAKYLTKYRSYTIKGGTNYRELLFRMPGATYSNSAMAVHWERSGVLAHARMQDLNTFLGKMLFIEEIQSDWHNEGHKSGYTSEADVARISELEDQIAQILTEKDKINEEYDAFLTRYWEENLSDEEYREYLSVRQERLFDLSTEQRALEKELYELSAGNDVPDAPFRDTYHEYVLKRLIRMAAEQDYDSIGWTTAQIQSDRWSDEFAEGYRIEYDQDIPKFLNKYGKKWGTKVGKTVLDSGTEVWSMAITDEMKESVLTEGQPLYSDRDTDSVSNRSLLANAFEGVAKNEIERNKIKEYKGKISLIEAEERKLQKLNEQIKELSFSKGPKDTKTIRDLQFEAKQTANRISTYDKQLLRLEASKPLQDVLTREKKMAYQRAEKKGKEALAAYRERATKTQRELMDKWQESRKRGVESREKTAMRHKIQSVVGELNQLLLNGDKKRHVPESLKKAVADALALVNMDTVGAEERAAKYANLIAHETDPDKIDAYTATMENILRQGEKMGQRLKELRDAYEEIQESDDPDIANAYDPVIAGCLKELSQSIGNTSLRNMTIEQLSDVYDMYRMVLTRVRDANKTFLNEKKESISNLASRVVGEVRKSGGEHTYRAAALDPVRKFLWNNLKPVYAFEHLGSATLTEAFNGVRKGEDTWAKDVTEARAYYLDKSRKYGYDGWDFKKKYRFESDSGIPFELTLEQILSLYAYSKREQAHDHLRLGGFVFDSNIETYKDKDSKLIKYKVNTADAHQITPEILASIIGTLSQEQMAFVDEMQAYLSTTMGAKGNEVTMKMYGVKLFKEKFYFPLKSAKQFMFEQNEVSGEVKIKNSGFTNKTVAKANNPIILSNFMDVWSGHVNDMSMYHSFVLPLEDFNRIFNYNSPKREGQPPVSVKGTIQSAYSPAAVHYVKNLITDLNGGARSDSTAGFINKMMGLFKKGSVFASLSVVVQQPSAIARAAALVDTKYFIGPKVDSKRHKALWEEVKQYAPVSIIKEMGYFDTNMGKSTQDFILAKEYSGFQEKVKALVTDSGYRDEILSKAPALADEMAWCSIWEAVKREMHDKYKGLDVKSEPFLMLAGSRFTEVITKTQVYDSVLSKSANMRSKDTGMKMATAFMAEPTTSINMIADALLQGKRGNRKYARAAIGAVIASQIFNSILVSFVYAGRDDDEDKTYWEKYIGTLSGEIVDSLNPAGYIPFIKDIQSIVQGYDVERSDMAVVSDLWNAWQNLKKDNVSVYRKVEGFAGSIAQIFGLPVKNIMRDVRGIWQTIESFMNGQQTTKAGIGYAVKSALPKWMGGGDVANQQQLYEAYLNGDQAQITRVEGRYKDQSAINSAIRKALRENDPRIKEAAQAKASGDLDEYMRLAKEIIGEKHFSQDNVVAAINAEINALSKDESTSSSTQKASGMFKSDDFAIAISNGDTAMANAIKTDIIQTAQKNGKSEAEAEKSFASSASASCKELFMEGTLSDNQAIKALVDFCGVEQEDAEERVGEWAFQKEYGFYYSDRGDAYKSGALTADELVDILMDVGGKTEEEAMWQVKVYDWQNEGYDIDLNQKSVVEDYETFCQPAGIDKNTYFDTYLFYKDSGEDGVAYSKTIDCMPYINSLPLTPAQKTALALCWWAESTVRKYKLW